jgi:hypothetical protein
MPIINKKIMIRQIMHKRFPISIGSIIKPNNNFSLFKSYPSNYSFSRLKNFKIISDPKDVSKLIFDDQGRCKIFEHKNA